MASRSYSELTLKKLFALSHNVCAFPSCDLRLADPSWNSVIADITHIEGLNKGSARHNPNLTSAESNSFENLILMCKNHNWHIDKIEPDLWPVDRLVEIKRAHETRRPGDSEPNAALRDQFVVQIAVALQIHVEAGGDEADELLEPAESMNIMRSAVMDLEPLEVALGIMPPVTMPDDWISFAYAARDRFEAAVAKAEEPGSTVPQHLIVELMDTAMMAFNATPAN